MVYLEKITARNNPINSFQSVVLAVNSKPDEDQQFGKNGSAFHWVFSYLATSRNTFKRNSEKGFVKWLHLSHANEEIPLEFQWDSNRNTFRSVLPRLGNSPRLGREQRQWAKFSTGVI